MPIKVVAEEIRNLATSSAATSKELSGQAEILKNMVDAFQLKAKNKADTHLRTRASKASKPIKTPPAKPTIIWDNSDKY